MSDEIDINEENTKTQPPAKIPDPPRIHVIGAQAHAYDAKKIAEFLRIKGSGQRLRPCDCD